MNQSGHILIIDDEVNLRQTLARILHNAGYEVTTAENGMQGIALLSQHNFDLLYMDIRMPDMSGLEVLKIIHADFPQLRVILFTAQPDLNSAVEALRSGATDYLLKPLKPEEVIRRTNAILSELKLERRKKEIQTQIEALQSELRDLDAEPGSEVETAIKTSDPDDRYLTRGKLTLDLHARQVILDGRLIGLPPTTFDYLLVLVRHTPDMVDYQTLVAEAQGFQTESREAKELTKWHIHHIRQALEQDQNNPTQIINLRNSGYRLIIN